MEEKQEIPVSGGVVSGVAEYWWWATSSTCQLTWAVSIYRKGYAGDSHLMPFKAFAVASLFIGATATAAVASLRASGIESVEDMKLAGTNIRNRLGIRPRP
ncbi:unnamed protein product [Fraxinus pennsylvanica]|uniref:Uncharacterized protein n=1 Tax=Fraxinus pennsylvanica TaxID=56036 RepID=A0AAD2AH41_9LAMI|nr:unnamed protein product [Fraxinus pennsylvanica]